MRRAVPLLSGFAILAVIFNHANWHVLEHFAPGDPAGLLYLIFDQIGKCAIAAFLTVAGYFIAYATAGGKNDVRWSIIRARLINLAWPWLIWSLIDLALHYALTRQFDPYELITTPFVHYYFIPLLMFYYLATPPLARLAKESPRRALLVAGIVQMLAIALLYARLYTALLPDVLAPWVAIGPLQYLRFAFFFPLGLVIGLYPQRARDRLARTVTALPWITFALFAASVGEAWLAYQKGGGVWPLSNDQTKITSTLFAVSLILTFAASERLTFAGDRLLMYLGSRTYGLYLTHYIFLGALARLIQAVWPYDASMPGWVMLPALFIGTVATSLLLMEAVARSPLRKAYRFLFG